MLYLKVGSPICFIISALFGIFTWQVLSSLIPSNIVLELFGRNLLIIMDIHIIILQIVTKIMRFITDSGSFMFFILYVITSCLSLIGSIFIKRYIPEFINYYKVRSRNGKI